MGWHMDQITKRYFIIAILFMIVSALFMNLELSASFESENYTNSLIVAGLLVGINILITLSNWKKKKIGWLVTVIFINAIASGLALSAIYVHAQIKIPILSYVLAIGIDFIYLLIIMLLKSFKIKYSIRASINILIFLALIAFSFIEGDAIFPLALIFSSVIIIFNIADNLQEKHHVWAQNASLASFAVFAICLMIVIVVLTESGDFLEALGDPGTSNSRFRRTNA